MNELFIKEIVDKTKDFLDNNQRIKLKELLISFCEKYEIIEITNEYKNTGIVKDNKQILNQFLSAKEVEKIIWI